jgi:hypothetical protein
MPITQNIRRYLQLQQFTNQAHCKTSIWHYVVCYQTAVFSFWVRKKKANEGEKKRPIPPILMFPRVVSQAVTKQAPGQSINNHVVRRTPRAIVLLGWGHDSAACKIQPVRLTQLSLDRLLIVTPKKIVPPALLLFRLLSPNFFFRLRSP